MAPFPLKSALTFAVPYGFVLSSLYLYFYWNPVGLNPFFYANAADLVTSTLGGIMLSLLGVFGGVTTGFLWNDIVLAARPPGKPSVRTIPWYIHILLFGLVASAIVLWVHDHPLKWMCSAGIMAAISPFLITRSSTLSAALPSVNGKVLASVIVFMLPAAFIAYGGTAIRKALNPRTGLQVDLQRTSLDMRTVGPVMYIGMLGDYHVLRELSSASTFLIPTNERIVVSRRQANVKVKRPSPVKSSPSPNSGKTSATPTRNGKSG